LKKQWGDERAWLLIIAWRLITWRPGIAVCRFFCFHFRSEGMEMNRTSREHRLTKQREYSVDCRERRLAAGRPKRSDVASALTAFLDSAVRHGAASSETVVDNLVCEGFNDIQARRVIGEIIQRHRKQC
jgi:hypothetical protein